MPPTAAAGAAVADRPLAGRHAEVTARGRGIGGEIASRLAAAGLDVAVNDVDGEALEAGTAAVEAAAETADRSNDVVGVRADVSDLGAVEHLIERTIDAFGGLDVLVNNVGVAGPTKPVEEVTDEEFMDTLAVNLGGQFNATKHAVPHLREGDCGGRIVNLASMSGKRPLADRTPYTTSKMGVIGFTRTLAVELADDGVTVNAVCPGSVAGPRLDAVIEGQAESQGRNVEDVEREFRKASPMDTFVEAGDVADAVLWLCSERADHVTGQDLNVTAGITMY
jgi:NAD(P)-dependent dehydrogenase (short-subunit alcohol dehydrogenase family)